MPDHLHLLIEGKDSDSDMKRFISSYKQYTGYHYKKKTGVSLWQINFYEHVLRKGEETMNVAIHNDIYCMSFPQAERVGNPSSTERFPPRRVAGVTGQAFD